MDSVIGATVANASAADLGTMQGQATLAVLKKALDMQASSAALMLQALRQPALATSGTLGTRVNAYA